MERRGRTQSQIQLPWGYLIGGLLLVVCLWLIFSPPRIWINITKRVDLSQPARTGEVLVNRYDCRNCHIVGDTGGWIAPSLVGATTRMEEATLWTWLREPSAIKGPTAMPNFSLSDSEIEAIIAYLRKLDETP